MVSGGRRSGSWGAGNAADREFHRILKAGVDVFKHSCRKFFLKQLRVGVRGFGGVVEGDQLRNTLAGGAC